MVFDRSICDLSGWQGVFTASPNFQSLCWGLSLRTTCLHLYLHKCMFDGIRTPPPGTCQDLFKNVWLRIAPNQASIFSMVLTLQVPPSSRASESLGGSARSHTPKAFNRKLLQQTDRWARTTLPPPGHKQAFPPSYPRKARVPGSRHGSS